MPFPGPSSSGDGCLASALSQVARASYSPAQSQPFGFPGAPWESSPRCPVCPLRGADLRLWHSWQMSTIQDPRKTLISNWEPAHSLVEDVRLRLQQPPCLPTLLPQACPSASGKGGPYTAAGLLSFDIHSILCSVRVPGVTRWGYSLFVPLDIPDPMVWVALTLAPSDCPQGIQAWSLH